MGWSAPGGVKVMELCQGLWRTQLPSHQLWHRSVAGGRGLNCGPLIIPIIPTKCPQINSQAEAECQSADGSGTSPRAQPLRAHPRAEFCSHGWSLGQRGAGGGVGFRWGKATSWWVLGFRQTDLTAQG